MQRTGSAEAVRVVRTYGRGSLLGLVSPLLAAFMASAGMRGWQDAAARAMTDDAVRMARQGYRVVLSEELGYPRLGVVWYRVTYEREPRSASPAPT